MNCTGKALGIDVKICGLTNLDDARAALDLGADYLGFVIYEGSPRGITGTTLRRIIEGLPNHARAVGVFVDTPRTLVLKIGMECGLSAVQLHGRERPEDYRDFGLPVWRAVCLEDRGPAPDPRAWNARRFLIDVKKPGDSRCPQSTADWEKAAEFVRKWPSMLAGGLNIRNIEAAVRKVRPLGVDVSSGIEREPGKKDFRKMASFIRLAKRASMD